MNTANEEWEVVGVGVCGLGKMRHLPGYRITQGDRMRPRRGWAVVALWVAAALSVGATPLVACDPVWLPIARPDGISVFVAVALADTMLDTAIAALKGQMHPTFTAQLDRIVGPTSGGQRVRLPGWEDSAGTAEGVLV